jgi:hypothetical protein
LQLKVAVLKHKIFSIFFILVLFAPSTGTYLCLLHRKEMVRMQVNESIREGIDKERLVLLGFTMEETETELRWEHSREFEYKSQMYDIVETKIVGDSIYYRCWWDIEETLIKNMISELGRFALDTDARKNDRKVHINPWFKLVFITESTASPLEARPQKTSKFIAYADLYNSLNIPPPKPPPRFS